MSDKPDTTATGVYLVRKRKKLPFLVYLAWILALVATAVMVFILAWPVVNLQLQNLVMVRIPYLHERPHAGVPDVYLADVSADGRYVVFATNATGLSHGIRNGRRHLYLLDRETGKRKRIHVGRFGTQTQIGQPVISADGHHVVFSARIPDSGYHIYVYDVLLGETRSIGETGPYSTPAISADGRYIAYRADIDQIVIHDQEEGSNSEVRPDMVPNGRYLQWDRPYVTSIYLTAAGRYLAFGVELNDEQGCASAIYDVESGNIAFIHPRCREFALSSNGRYFVVQETYDQDQFGIPIVDFTVYDWQAGEKKRINDSNRRRLLPADINFANDLFIHDRVLGHTTRISPVSWQAMLFFVLLFLDVAGTVIIYNSRRMSKTSEEDFSTL